MTTSTTRPQNDDILDAILLYGSQVSTTGTNINATAESLEPRSLFPSLDPTLNSEPIIDSDINSVWWRWIAPMDGQVLIDTFGSDYDTTLRIYRSDRTSRENSALVFKSLVDIAINDDAENPPPDSSFLQSQIQTMVKEGEIYYIAVDGFGDAQGDIALNLTMPPNLENDNFSSRLPLIGTRTTTTGTNTWATGEASEPNHASSNFSDTDTQSVWWTWTAPSDGLVTVDTFGSDYDTTLAIYEGVALEQLLEVASNDDSFTRSEVTSDVLFSAEAGKTYQIAVDGFGNAQGEIRLSLNMDFEITQSGSQNADVLQGTNTNDVIRGGQGADRINGRQGHDYLLGQSGDDVINGGPGNDWIDGGSGIDVLTGGKGRDLFFGGAGDDLIFGGPGNDTLYSSGGNDQMNSGSGLDTLWLRGPETVVLEPGKGYDTINNFQVGVHQIQVRAINRLSFTDQSAGVHIFQGRDRLAIVPGITADMLRDNMADVFSELG